MKIDTAGRERTMGQLVLFEGNDHHSLVEM